MCTPLAHSQLGTLTIFHPLIQFNNEIIFQLVIEFQGLQNWNTIMMKQYPYANDELTPKLKEPAEDWIEG